MPAVPTPYEIEARAAIEAWRNPPDSWFGAASRRLDGAWDQATDLVRRVPGVEWTIEHVVAGLLEVIGEITHDTLWRDGIFLEFKRTGAPVRSLEDIRALDLSVVDRALEGLSAKYQALAGAEGATTGMAGLAGIVPDIVSLVAINLRAVGETATYCSFDMTLAEERLFALRLLDVVAGGTDSRKRILMEPAVRVAKSVARRQGVQAIEQMGFSEAVERLARAIGIHLTGQKVAQVVPVAGAVVGAGLNVMYTRKVCATAFHLYRERFLDAKYGPA